jgi:large subunit ribosomal protein L13
MDMNKAFFLRKEDAHPAWRVIDAQGLVVGRLATTIANILRGKDKPSYTAHTESGDYVVVINSDKIVFTGDKLEQKTYEKYTGYIGNKKYLTAKQIMAKDSTRIIELAVKGMLPKNRISRQLLRKLRVYTGDQHPHGAQIAEFKK